MDYTKKIIYQSNYWYNDGLRKAQIRDLSGAILSLRRSLQYNRGNIAARNLLGLVYYGRGEVAEALVEWIISKNLRPRDNIANEYIQKVQDSARELEMMNQAVKKYNQCLVYCEQNGEDLAVIQLKKVVADFPQFLKAQQLLALLYLKSSQYSKARQVLKKARRLDTTNDMTLRYVYELSQHKSGRSRKEEKKSKETVEYSLGNETIIQPAHHAIKQITGKFTVMNLVLGALIGAAVIIFLILPAVEESRSNKENKQMIEYSERINALEAQISAQTRMLDEYRATNEDTEAAAQTAASTSDSYENLLNAIEQYRSENYSEEMIADTLLNINREALGTAGQASYDEIASEVFPSACDIKYEAGMASFDVANYDTAIDNLSKVVRMDESYNEGGALLNLALACMRNGDSASATNYLKRVMELFPDSEHAAEAATNLNSIAEESASGNKEADTQ